MTWIVDVKGNRKRGHEISVIKDTNKHGFLSWGWPGKDKQIISDSGSFTTHYLREDVFEAIIKSAHDIARMLNEQEN